MSILLARALVRLRLLSFNRPAKSRDFNGLSETMVTKGNPAILARNLLYIAEGLVCLPEHAEC